MRAANGVGLSRPTVFIASVGRRLPVTLLWKPEDPFAVELRFGRDCSWFVARDLLDQGLRHPLGDGDVRLRPGGNPLQAYLTLCSPDGTATFEIDGWDLAEFLAATYDRVPAGHEVIPDKAYLELLS